MLRVREGSRRHDHIDDSSAREALPSLEELRAMFGHTEPGSPDVLTAEALDEVVGYSHVLWRWTEEDGTWVGLHLGYVLPAWRHRGIGRAMVAWSQGRPRQLKAIEAPEARGVFATNASSTEREATH